MTRKLKAEWTMESTCQAVNSLATDGTFDYVPEVKWYQFKRYRILFKPTENYLKSRLYFLMQCRKLTKALEEEINKEMPYKWRFTSGHPTILRHQRRRYFRLVEKVVRVLAIIVAVIYAILLIISLY